MNLLRMILLLVAMLGVAAPSFGEKPTDGAKSFLSSDPSDRPSTVPHDSAIAEALKNSRINLVIVNHEGWRETMLSFARLKVYQITGRTQIKGQDPVYTVLSMMFQPDRWYDARILPVEHPDLLTALSLDGKWVSPRAVIDNPKLPVVMKQVEDFRALRRKLDETTDLLNALEQTKRLGREFRVLDSFRDKGITPERLLDLLQSPDEQGKVFESRRQLQQEVNSQKAYHEAAEKLVNRTRTMPDLPDELLIVPDSESIDGRWVRPVNLSGGLPIMSAARDFESALGTAFVANEPEKIAPAVDAFLAVAEQSRYYDSQTRRQVNNWYVQSNPWRMASGLYLLGAAVIGFWFFFGGRVLYVGALGLMGLGFASHTGAMLSRLYLTGHAPVSNMFESITFCSWAVMAIAAVAELITRRGLVALGAMAVGFLLLTGAGLMPLHETRLHPLRAVLNSYWLNIHVTLMLISYAAFAISAFFALVYLLRSFSGAEGRRALLYTLAGAVPLLAIGGGMYLINNAAPLNSAWALLKTLSLALGVSGIVAALLLGVTLLLGMMASARGIDVDAALLPLPQMEEFAYRLVQVGWPILTFGITLGAVWADTAWGRYWGWDPKETWAFITWVAYTVYLHSRMVMGWRGRWSAAACLAGWLMVMITWWGVSYLPWFSGGLHSYASPR